MTALRVFAIARPSLIGAPVVGMSRQDREINRLARARRIAASPVREAQNAPVKDDHHA